MTTIISFILACCVCDPAVNSPSVFATDEDRGRWAAEHRDTTGHNTWYVADKQQVIEP